MWATCWLIGVLFLTLSQISFAKVNIAMVPLQGPEAINAGNCVSYLKETKGIKLPANLVNWEAKRAIINAKEPKKGYVAIIRVPSGEWAPYGHVALLVEVRDNGREKRLVLEEANYPRAGIWQRTATGQTIKEIEKALNIEGYYALYPTASKSIKTSLNKEVEKDYGPLLNDNDRVAIAQFLSKNRQFKVATKQDRPQYVYRIGGTKATASSSQIAKKLIGPKEKIEKQPIGPTKWGPFLIKGDFNGDGYMDLAVTFVEKGIAIRDTYDSGPFSVVVFHGSPGGYYSNPIMILKRFNLSWGDLDFVPKDERGKPVLWVRYPWGGGGIQYTWQNGKYIKKVSLGP
jgi:hypothetical protein